MFQIKRLDAIRRAQYNSCSSSVVNEIAVRKVVQVVPGVETAVAVNEVKTKLLET